MIGKIILIVILILVVLFAVVVIAGFITLFLLLAYGEDPDHENLVNVPRGRTMGTTRTTNISRTSKK